MSQDDLIQRAYARLDAKIEAKPFAKKPSLAVWSIWNRPVEENSMIVNIIMLPFTLASVAFAILWGMFVWFPCVFLVCLPYWIIMYTIGREEVTKIEGWLLYWVFGWQIFEAIVDGDF
jgi:hypothetical protein